jgi:hypothetical protein
LLVAPAYSVGKSATAKRKADCGDTTKIGPGQMGGKYGGTAYTDLDGVPVVSFAGRGVSCVQLKSLAHAYRTLENPSTVNFKFIGWLTRHHWTWMNYDDQARPYSLFNLRKNDVFIGSRPGQRSQIAFGKS